jgi:hypothetical protein
VLAPDDVAALGPEHVARFLASAEALRRLDGTTKRTGSRNAARSSLCGFFEYAARAGSVGQRSDGTSDNEVWASGPTLVHSLFANGVWT